MVSFATGTRRRGAAEAIWVGFLLSRASASRRVRDQVSHVKSGKSVRELLHGLVPVLIAAATAALFFRVLDYPFLNWDDQEVIIRNEALRALGVMTWAFTTRYMEHYQPLAWLTWGSLERTIGLTATTAHALNAGLHAVCATLVYLLTRRIVNGASQKGGAALQGCVAAALFWALHPLRVEPVVWASAMPYPLALGFALLATLAWSSGRSWSAVILFALSLLARPLALALPLVLWIVRRPSNLRDRVALAAMAAIAIGAGVVESSARLTASLSEFGPGARLTLAATAPWRYLWRTIWPLNLTPLDPLALTPRTEPLAILLGLIGITIVTSATWKWRRDYPVLAAAWASYLLLLAPAMGLVPSGLQATADRYTYLPAVPISIAIACTIAMAHRAMAAVATGLAVTVLAALTLQQTQYWRDSVTLWTRAVQIDPRNDVALYNLASALSDAGRRDEAIARYDEVLAIVPAHEASRRNRDLLVAARLEEEGNRLAAGLSLDAAIERYAEAVRLDPRRTHSQAALGMALTERGRYEEARPYLQAAIEQGEADPAVPNALAFVLVQTGQADAAITVLREALRRYPGDKNIGRNLMMLEKRKGGP